MGEKRPTCAWYGKRTVNDDDDENRVGFTKHFQLITGTLSALLDMAQFSVRGPTPNPTSLLIFRQNAFGVLPFVMTSVCRRR